MVRGHVGTAPRRQDSDYDKLYGLATIDENKQSAKVLLGGQDGNISVVLKQVDKTKTFENEKKYA